MCIRNSISKIRFLLSCLDFQKCHKTYDIPYDTTYDNASSL